MAVAPGDINFYLSGGASNADPNASLGGQVSNSDIPSATPENLFGNVQADDAVSGITDYRCFYVKNENLTDTLSVTVVWIAAQTSSADTAVEIGVDPAGVGDGTTTGVAVSIPDEVTPPAGVTFSAPADASSGLPVGDLGPGQMAAIWVKRVVNPNADATGLDDFRLGIRGVS